MTEARVDKFMSRVMSNLDGKKDAEIKRLRTALQRILAIENELYGGDWDEIEHARDIAAKALGVK